MAKKELDTAVAHWLEEIRQSKKREKDYLKDGKDIKEIYNGENKNKTPFNILYSNTETLLPALYSQTPTPVVKHRYKDGNPIGQAAARAGQRMLEFLADTNIDGYETFDDTMTSSTLDALLPGRGTAMVKYEADILEGDPKDPKASPSVRYETVCTDSRVWNRVYYGFAHKWVDVPWIAYEEYLDQKEAEALFGKPIAKKIDFVEGEQSDDKEDESRSQEEHEKQGKRKTALIYQIWDKLGGKKIRYISPNYKDGELKVEDDPLGLTGFYNCPKPLRFIRKANDLKVSAPYSLYKNQAEELNNLTKRIKGVTSSIKVVGGYSGDLGTQFAEIFEGDDNNLIPLEGTMLDKGLDSAIWIAPVEKLIVVLRELLGAREQAKKVIYEITGISDILRGQSAASETLGAQKIKESWGTMRLKRMQKDVQSYSRDLLRMMLEVAAKHFQVETWAKATGLPYVMQAQHDQAKQQMAMFQSQASQAAMKQGPGGQQQPPPEPPPELVKILESPIWEQVIASLKNDLQRAYLIDIETNSTIDAEATDDRKNVTEVMTAIGQYLNGVTPLITSGSLPFEAAQAMLLAIIRRFRFGDEIEEYIKQMKAPQPEDSGQKEAQQKTQQQMQQLQQAVAQSQQQLQAAQAKEELDRRSYELSLREKQMAFDESLLKINKQYANESIAARDKVYDMKNQNDQKVQTLTQQSSKREQQVAQKADGSLTKGVGAMQQTVQQLTEMSGSLLQTLAQQSSENQDTVQQIIAAVTAPKKAIRGPDGRVEGVVTELNKAK